MATAPDVFLFVVDSLREDAVAYEPGRDCETPQFASFAERSAVFDTAITHGIGTAPAMTALLSGSLPLSAGGHWWLAEDRWTIAEILQGAGYETGALHTNPNVSRLRNFHQGFDQFDENLLPIVSGGFVERVPDRVIHAANKAIRLLRRTPYLPASALRRKIIRWVDNTTSPRFLWTQFMDVHGPYLAHDGFGFRDKLRAERIWRTATTAPEDVTPDMDRELKSRYKAEIRYWDAEFGALLDALSARDVLDDALVVVTSDHGDEFGEHGQYGHGNNAYEEVARVPLVINFPGDRHAGTRVSQPVRLLDVVPTILDEVDVSPPAPASDQLVGRNLRDSFTQEMASEFATVIEKQVRGADSFRFAVRTARFKYIDDRYAGREELYDLNADPEELVDVSDSYPAVVDEMRSRVAARVSEISTVTARGGAAESSEVHERLEQLGYVE
jgi:arylsulfatase A-like enzyme